MTHSLTPGATVEILLSTGWTGPFTVRPGTGRTPDHALLASSTGGTFEHYVDEFNTRTQLTVADLEIAASHLSADLDTIRTHALRAELNQQALLRDALHAMRAGSIDAAIDLTDRALAAADNEIEFLRSR